jgi:hypothetical protein
VSRDVVAEQHDEVRAKRIRLFDNRFDALDIHPRLASVEVGDNRDREIKVCGPARKLEVVARHPLPQIQLDEARIGRRCEAEEAERSEAF